MPPTPTPSQGVVSSVDKGDDSADPLSLSLSLSLPLPLPLPPGNIRARFVVRRSSWESWLHAKQRLMTGLSRPPLLLQKLPMPGIVFVGEGDDADASVAVAPTLLGL